ncbi:MAG: SusC/RagA family TonB-linked outer membrane protein [Rikenellaceae bacterium]
MKKHYILILSLVVATNSITAQNSDSLALAAPIASRAYVSVSQDDSLFEKAPEADVAKALYGALPGVSVTSSNVTSASDNAAITIHGKTPLVLIDGFQRSISELHNYEIESITILKDAASLAIYGTQGANGVIVIETKRGANERLKVSANYQFGLSTAFRQPEFADAYTYATNYNAARLLDGLSETYNEYELEAFKNGTYPSYYPSVDWMDQVYNDFGYNHKLDLTFQGGNKTFRYFTMVEYMKDTALYRSNSDNSGYSTDPTDTRLGVRGNVDVNLSTSTLIRFGVMARISESNLSASASEASAAAFNTPSAAFPVRLLNGVYGSADGYGANNATALLNSTGINNTTYTTMIADLKLQQSLDFLTEGLSAEAAVSFDYAGSMYDNASDSYRYGEYNAKILDGGIIRTDIAYDGEDASVLTYDSDFNALSVRSTFYGGVDYKKSIGDNNLSGALVYSHNSTILNGQNTSMKRQSVIAKASYNYADRYYVDFATSYAGTSYLEPGARFNWYPAANVAWDVKKENFLSDYKLIDRLKIFASYGLSATDSYLDYNLYTQYYSTTNAGSYLFTTGYTPYYGQAEEALPAEGLKAEQSLRFTAGFDMGLFNNKLSLYGEYFNDKRSNVLITMGSVSEVIGVSLSQQSTGKTNYSGVDFGASWSDRKGDWGYGVQLNGSYYTSEIVDNGQAFQQYDYLYQSGNEVSQQYGLEAVGFFADQVDINNSPSQSFSDVRPGDVKYQDQNGDGVIDSQDIVKMYDSSDPSFVFGLNFNVSYKNFEIYAAFQGVSGVTKSLLNTGLYDPLISYGNLSSAFLWDETTWTADNAANATMPRLTTQENSNNYQNSSLWLRNFSYMKLRNLTIAYNLPRKITKFADVQIYLQGTDLFSVDGIGFTDPEAISSEYYLSTKSYWAGVKFNF